MKNEYSEPEILFLVLFFGGFSSYKSIIKKNSDLKQM